MARRAVQHPSPPPPVTRLDLATEVPVSADYPPPALQEAPGGSRAVVVVPMAGTGATCPRMGYRDQNTLLRPLLSVPLRRAGLAREGSGGPDPGLT